MVAGTMSGAVRSVILQHFAKGGTLPPGPLKQHLGLRNRSPEILSYDLSYY